MKIELDHLFVFTGAGALAADLLAEAGLAEGAPNTHPGQGTSNRRFFFHNAMLELLWVRDEREARSPAIAPARLWERGNYLSTGYSPFGLCFRASACEGTAEPGRTTLPFATWEFRPPYLPPGTRIEVAAGTAGSEPLVFTTPFGGRPDSESPGHRRTGQPLDHPAGFGEMTGVKITLPTDENLSEVLGVLQSAGLVAFETGEEHLAEVEFDLGLRGGSADFRPRLPLRFRW